MHKDSSLQNRIMSIVDSWVRSEKQPVPRNHIVMILREDNVPAISIKVAFSALIKKGYIRKAIKSSSYIQLRSL